MRRAPAVTLATVTVAVVLVAAGCGNNEPPPPEDLSEGDQVSVETLATASDADAETLCNRLFDDISDDELNTMLGPEVDGPAEPGRTDLYPNDSQLRCELHEMSADEGGWSLEFHARWRDAADGELPEPADTQVEIQGDEIRTVIRHADDDRAYPGMDYDQAQAILEQVYERIDDERDWPDPEPEDTERFS